MLIVMTVDCLFLSGATVAEGIELCCDCGVECAVIVVEGIEPCCDCGVECAVIVVEGIELCCDYTTPVSSSLGHSEYWKGMR